MTTTPTRNGVHWLIREHDEIRALFKAFESATDAASKRKIVDEFVTKISMHASCEERYLYPLFPNTLPNGSAIYDRAVVDDEVNKKMTDLLLRMDPQRDGELYDNTVKKFITVERDHIQQEEVWLREFEAILTPQQLHQLEDNLIYAKSNAPTRPHPEGPSTGLAAQLMHPIAGAVDRAMGHTSQEQQQAQSGQTFPTPAYRYQFPQHGKAFQQQQEQQPQPQQPQQDTGIAGTRKP